MIGIIGIIASVIVLGLSMLITRIATIALSLTGLSYESAKFQARSAFTGTGFTTSEAESVVNHPVRRRIIMMLMVARSAGFISIIISLILSFGDKGSYEFERLIRLCWLVAGIAILWFLAGSKRVEQWMSRLIKKLLNKWTDLEIRDYNELLKLSGDFSVLELQIDHDDWLAGKKIIECSLHEEGILILGIYRADGEYTGAPTPEFTIDPCDTMILYGRGDILKKLHARKAGLQGEAEHQAATDRQKEEWKKQAKKEQNYKKEHGKNTDPFGLFQ